MNAHDNDDDINGQFHYIMQCPYDMFSIDAISGDIFVNSPLLQYSKIIIICIIDVIDHGLRPLKSNVSLSLFILSFSIFNF